MRRQEPDQRNLALFWTRFIGSGTVCCVAIDKGRHSVGIDLSESYLTKNAIPRITGELLSRPALAHLAGLRAKKIETGKNLLK